MSSLSGSGDDGQLHLRAAILHALDALETGDTRRAVDALLAVDDAAAAACDRRCPRCSFAGPPGLLEFHLLHAHGLEWDDVEELVRRAA